MVNYEPLKELLPSNVYDELLNVSTRFVINSPLRMAHFLAQCAHESQGFEKTEENLNYSAKRLMQVFPRHFDVDKAEIYAHNNVKIACRVYAGRMGNKGESSQDGWYYRGRGFIQLTGFDNYAKFDLFVNDDILYNPDLVSTRYPLLSAAWFWSTNLLNDLADDNDIVNITRRINGGLNGLDERMNYFDRYFSAI